MPSFASGVWVPLQELGQILPVQFHHERVHQGNEEEMSRTKEGKYVLLPSHLGKHKGTLLQHNGKRLLVGLGLLQRALLPHWRAVGGRSKHGDAGATIHN